MQTISSSQINTLYSLLRYTNHILFSDKHNKSFSTDKHNMSFSQIYTISSSQRNTILCTVIHYILFSDKCPISSCQIRKLFPFLIYTNHILFTDKHTIFSLQKCILYPLPGKDIISSSQK